LDKCKHVGTYGTCKYKIAMQEKVSQIQHKHCQIYDIRFDKKNGKTSLKPIIIIFKIQML
jgi:hypothetical protein